LNRASRSKTKKKEPTGDREFGKRLRELREEEGISQVSFAKTLGVKVKQTISNWERGVTMPTDEKMALMREKYEFNPVFLKTGKGDRRVKHRNNAVNEDNRRAGVELLISSPILAEYNTNFVKVNVYQGMGAGNPIDRREYDPIDTVVVPRKYYNSHIIYVRVDGDSMEPLINQWAIVAVDQHQRELVDKKIYCFRVPDGGFIIRRVHKRIDRIILEPYNTTYASEEYNYSDFEPDNIVGRIIANVLNPIR